MTPRKLPLGQVVPSTWKGARSSINDPSHHRVPRTATAIIAIFSYDDGCYHRQTKTGTVLNVTTRVA